MKGKAGMESGDKLGRQRAIVEILAAEEVGTQEDLTAAMKRRGFHCTQTTISRDFAELNVTKVGGVYKSLSDISVGPLERAFAEHALGAMPAGDHLIVLKTRIGSASAVAIELDRAGWKEIAGTVAGDDTIFIALPGRKEGESVMRKLNRLLGGEGK